VHNYRELIAWQLAERFKEQVFDLVSRSSALERDLKYRSQLLEAASSVSKNIAEGFRRYTDGYINQFFNFALGSLYEAEERLRDGIKLGYFVGADCQEALRYAKRCTVATIRFKRSRRSRSRPPESDERRT
jgi:four helix bundle protein